MTAAGCRSASDDLDPTSAEMGAFYAAMRDAYLEASPTEPE